MNSAWFKNRANQKFDVSIDLLYKVKDNIQYIRGVKETYGYKLDTILREDAFHIIDTIDNNISECLKLMNTNSLEIMRLKTVAQKRMVERSKTIALKVIVRGINVYCPVCVELITDTYQHGVTYVHKCPYCNQKLDWEIESDLIGGNYNDL